LQLGWEGSVEIFGDVGDSEEVLPKSTLFLRRLIRNQLGLRLARFGDDDLLAGGSALDQLRKVRLGSVEVDHVGHGSTSGSPRIGLG